jgi:hypothetical protein
MTSEKQEREASIVAITLGLVLLFGAVALTLAYVASHIGLLPGGPGGDAWVIGLAATD